jgi:aminopeptidase-like protein
MSLAKELESYFDRLWPILRSITGEGVRQTHAILSEIVRLESYEIPSGTQVFDWTVPKEWKVNEAYLIDPHGKRILDVKDNNLHLVNYSIPFRGVVSKEELGPHLYSLPDKPTAIPYVTSYYAPRWGFCLSHNEREALPEGSYQVVIDTEFIDGSLTLSEAVLPGNSKDETLISAYTPRCSVLVPRIGKARVPPFHLPFCFFTRNDWGHYLFTPTR